MFLARKLLWTAALCWALSASSCDIYKEPKELDPTPFLGCYSDNELFLRLYKKYLAVNDQIFAYEIEFRKVGLGVNTMFAVMIRPSGDLFIAQSEIPMFYRITYDNGVPIIIVADDTAQVYSLIRQPSCE